jgi:hypothetical protein
MTEKINKYGNIRIKKVHTLQRLHILKIKLGMRSLEETVDYLLDKEKK